MIAEIFLLSAASPSRALSATLCSLHCLPVPKVPAGKQMPQKGTSGRSLFSRAAAQNTRVGVPGWQPMDLPGHFLWHRAMCTYGRAGMAYSEPSAGEVTWKIGLHQLQPEPLGTCLKLNALFPPMLPYLIRRRGTRKRTCYLWHHI